ncbi:Phage Gp37Gp68 (plasmid) [Cupriavidus taiwanensis]|uniref:Phage Gp37Gp68 n=1 Tax=Cupriavidus taiwanensis TaxID=164546 RepID=A0A375EHA7_9BURK|nr:phage Gp37/Gp68 family protein [Cupriavidus taiwanensis]SOZ72679.1 Phage Gp37Gp68 [Cupriavidus taiwanensis]SOZ73349.1 Phage Gp37Gp68 [Cupriavidus taiwanensis]SOZ75163.1 Phage Gp37Gp68 [Cupriavidus taiwanensis]SPA03728.1 Phage Gp37Gp68 [Cupriavidus taiwanensis]SPA11632.1 Phage Gp37Gp68 [Cupriavidus taiwanensis]
MSDYTRIEWADHTWNPWEGCQKVGPGCDHCYAEARNARFAGGIAINWGPGAPRRRTSAANWRKPLLWDARHAAFAAVHGRRQRVFCASLADMFDNAVPLEWFIDVLEVWRRTPNLDKLVLSKRIGNATRRLEAALEHLLARGDSGSTAQWLDSWLEGNAPADIWLGATVVNQCEADRDIPKLMRVPASMRFLSMEPLLGHVDVFSVAGAPTMIDWVIAGGESGPGARPMHPDWPRSLRDQCAAAGVPFLFKQHGEWAPGSGDFGAGRYETAAVARDGRAVHGGFEAAGYPAGASSADGWSMVHRAGKRHAGRLLDGEQHDEFPISSADIAQACRQALYKETA